MPGPCRMLWQPCWLTLTRIQKKKSSTVSSAKPPHITPPACFTMGIPQAETIHSPQSKPNIWTQQTKEQNQSKTTKPRKTIAWHKKQREWIFSHTPNLEIFGFVHHVVVGGKEGERIVIAVILGKLVLCEIFALISELGLQKLYMRSLKGEF